MKRLLLGFGIVLGAAKLMQRFMAPAQPSWEETDNDPEDRLRAGHPDDATLVDRVRSEIFRDTDAPKAEVNVNAEYGRVILRGQVESEDLIRDLVERTRRVDGVQDVENQLSTPVEP